MQDPYCAWDLRGEICRGAQSWAKGRVPYLHFPPFYNMKGGTTSASFIPVCEVSFSASRPCISSFMLPFSCNILFQRSLQVVLYMDQLCIGSRNHMSWFGICWLTLFWDTLNRRVLNDLWKTRHFLPSYDIAPPLPPFSCQ
jgi:hypothetical protein